MESARVFTHELCIASRHKSTLLFAEISNNYRTFGALNLKTPKNQDHHPHSSPEHALRPWQTCAEHPRQLDALGNNADVKLDDPMHRPAASAPAYGGSHRITWGETISATPSHLALAARANVFQRGGRTEETVERPSPLRDI